MGASAGASMLGFAPHLLKHNPVSLISGLDQAAS
jgi:hypothetical protein